MLYCSVMKTIDCHVPCVKSSPTEFKNTDKSKFINDIFRDHQSAKSPLLSDRKVFLNSTPAQRLKIVQNHAKRNEFMKTEREIFYMKRSIEIERINRDKHFAAVLIQSCYRGYLSRKTPNSLVISRRKHVESSHLKLNDVDIKEELCKLANALGLRPIRGLTLESNKIYSRRRNKMRKVSSCKLVRFFRMIVARKKARRIMDDIKISRKHAAATIIQRFARYVKVKRITINMQRQRDRESATIIQKEVRAHLARNKLRELKKEQANKRREYHTATTIQTILSYAMKQKRKKYVVMTKQLPTITSSASTRIDPGVYSTAHDAVELFQANLSLASLSDGSLSLGNLSENSLDSYQMGLGAGLEYESARALLGTILGTESMKNLLNEDESMYEEQGDKTNFRQFDTDMSLIEDFSISVAMPSDAAESANKTFDMTNSIKFASQIVAQEFIRTILDNYRRNRFADSLAESVVNETLIHLASTDYDEVITQHAERLVDEAVTWAIESVILSSLSCDGDSASVTEASKAQNLTANEIENSNEFNLVVVENDVISTNTTEIVQVDVTEFDRISKSVSNGLHRAEGLLSTNEYSSSLTILNECLIAITEYAGPLSELLLDFRQRILYFMAEGYLLMTEYKKAIETLDQLEPVKDCAEISLLRGRVMIEVGRFSEAETCLKEVACTSASDISVQQQFDDAKALLLLCKLKIKQGQYAELALNFEILKTRYLPIAIDTKTVISKQIVSEIYYVEGLLFKLKGSFRKAIRRFRSSVDHTACKYETSLRLYQLSLVFLELCDFTNAIDYFELSYDIVQRIFGRDMYIHIALIESILLQGRIALKLQRPLEAEKCFNTASKLLDCRKAHGCNADSDELSLLCAQYLLGIAEVYRLNAQHEKAISNCKEAVSSLVQYYGSCTEAHLDIADAHYNLGRCYLDTQQFYFATTALEKASSIYKANFGAISALTQSNSNPTSTLLNLEICGIWLGLSYIRTYHLDDGHRLIARGAIEICRFVGQGSDHQLVADSLYAMGEAALLKGRYLDSYQLFQHAITMVERLYKDSDESILDLLRIQSQHTFELTNNINSTLSAVPGREIYLTERVKPGNSWRSDIDTLIQYNIALAQTLRKPGDYQQAKIIVNKTLRMALSFHDPSHIVVAKVLHERANLLRDTGDYLKAEMTYKRAKRIFEVYYPSSNKYSQYSEFSNSTRADSRSGIEQRHIVSTQVATLLVDIGDCLRLNHKLIEAEEMLTAALASFEHYFQADNSYYALDARVALALVDMDVNKVDQMLTAYDNLSVNIYPRLAKILPEIHPLLHYISGNIGLCVNAISVFYYESGDAIGLETFTGNNTWLLRRLIQNIELGKPNEKFEFEVQYDSMSTNENALKNELPGQEMVDDALEYLEKYNQGPFNPQHPWFIRFGMEQD